MVLAAPMVVTVAAIVFALSAVALLKTIPQELTPREDRAIAIMRISAPQGVSLEFTSEKIRELERLMQPLRDSGEVQNMFSIAGTGGSANNGFMVLTLAPWHERSRSQDTILAEVTSLVATVPGVRVTARQANSLGIRDAGNGLQFALVGNSYDAMGDAAQKIVEEMEKDPRYGQV